MWKILKNVKCGNSERVCFFLFVYLWSSSVMQQKQLKYYFRRDKILFFIFFQIFQSILLLFLVIIIIVMIQRGTVIELLLGSFSFLCVPNATTLMRHSSNIERGALSLIPIYIRRVNSEVKHSYNVIMMTQRGERIELSEEGNWTTIQQLDVSISNFLLSKT